MGLLAEAACELLWPTRCVLCDAPGTLLCDSCRKSLEFIDRVRACPRCGSPWGKLQCDRCNPVAEETLTQATPCVSCFRYEENAANLIKAYKDKGERRLAETLARFVADIVDPTWNTWAQAVTYVPASDAALKKRGFDHMERIASAYGETVGLPCVRTLEEVRAADQRTLDRRGRISNMQGRFRAARGIYLERVILLDDVITTGATLSNARQALRLARCETRIATIARA